MNTKDLAAIQRKRIEFQNIDDNYSFSEFREALSFSSMCLKDLLKSLYRCVGRLNTGFVVKMRFKGLINYEEVKRSNLNEYFGFLVHYYTPSSDDDDDDEDKTPKSEKLSKIIERYENRLAMFDGFDIISDEAEMLSIYRPPKGTYIKGLAERFIQIFEKQVKNKESFHEMLSSHAYRFRHPGAFIEKCFIYFSSEGNTGKSLLSAIIGSMYHRFGAPALRISQVSEDKNGFLTDYLYAHIEELQNEQYRNHFFETLLKQMTTKNTASRKLYKDTVATVNRAIFGFNTNKEDLYGLIRLPVGSPEYQRCVPIWFTNPLLPNEWNKIKTDLGMNDSVNTEHDFRNLGYTLYYYLKNKYPIKEKFTPCRYYGEDKELIWKELQKSNKGYLDQWLSNLRFTNCTDVDIDDEYKILTIMNDNQRNQYVGFRNTDKLIGNTFDYFKKQTKCNCTYSPASIRSFLVEKGFHQLKTRGYNMIRIEKDKFDELVKSEYVEEDEIVNDPDNEPVKESVKEITETNTNEITDEEVNEFVSSDKCGSNKIESRALFMKKYHKCSLKEFDEKIGCLLF